jgi:transposase InsO family protein
VVTSPYCPQSSGKLQRLHKTLKQQTSYPKAPHTLDDSKRLLAIFFEHYNHHRLHSAFGDITPPL